MVASLSMATVFVLGATRIAQASRHLRMQNNFRAEAVVRAEMDDIESEMSALLAKSGVIREDIYNKPGDQYTLHVQQSGPFVQIPLLHGTFRFAGAYAGAYGGLWAGGLGLRGGLPGGLAGMFAGVPMGMHAGEKAAETLSRIAQGQGRIVYKPEENSLVQTDMQVLKADMKDQAAEDLENAVQAFRQKVFWKRKRCANDSSRLKRDARFARQEHTRRCDCNDLDARNCAPNFTPQCRCCRSVKCACQATRRCR